MVDLGCVSHVCRSKVGCVFIWLYMSCIQVWVLPWLAILATCLLEEMDWTDSYIYVYESFSGGCALCLVTRLCLTLCGWGSQWGSGGGSQTRAPQLRGWGSSTSLLGSDFLIPQLPGWGTLSSWFCALVLGIILGDQAKNYFFPPFNNFVAPNSIT